MTSNERMRANSHAAPACLCAYTVAKYTSISHPPKTERVYVFRVIRNPQQTDRVGSIRQKVLALVRSLTSNKER